MGWEPDRAIEIIAGTPPGGGQDRAARSLAAAFGGLLDVPVSVTNVPGRGGGNAWDHLATLAADGHHLSISSPTMITNRLTGVTDLGPDDLSQLALLCTEFIAFAVPMESPLSSAADLVGVLGNPTPPTVSLATARGNVNHIAVAYLCHHVGVDPRRLSIRVFDSARHAIADALETPQGIAAVSAASLVPEVEAGSIRVLASSAPERLDDPLGAIPTWTELGVECSIGTWRGVVGPPKLAADVVAFWDEALSSAITTPAWQTALSEHNWTNSFLSSSATQQFMREEEIRIGEALRSLDLG